MNDLRSLQQSPEAFRAAILIDVNGSPVRLGDVLEPWQDDDFRSLDDAWRRVAGQAVEPKYLRAWLERPRGHSKTSDLAASCVWTLFASRRKLSGICAAADKEQAGLIRNAVDGLVRLNSWLRRFIEVNQWTVRNPHTGSELTILSNDVASSYGLLCDFIVCDEVTHWRSSGLWESLLSTAAKRPSCLLLVITNAGHQPDWQWGVREAIRSREDWFFHALNGPQASWITPAILEEQRALLPPSAYARLWENRWASGSGDAFLEGDIRAAVTLPGEIHSAEKGWAYCLGLDVGLRHDSTAAVLLGKHVGYVERRPAQQPTIRNSTLAAMVDLGLADAPLSVADEITVHPGSGRLKVCKVHTWTPSKGQTVDLLDVAGVVELVAKRFRAVVSFDPFQAVMLAQQLRSKGVQAVEVGFTPQNLKGMARSMLDAVQDRQIDLFDHPDLLADLRSVRIVEKQYGIRLDSGRKQGEAGTRHSDISTALSIALFAARGLRSESSYSQRQLVLSH